MIRVALLLLAATCAFVAMVTGFRWGWFGIDPSARLYQGYIAASAMFFALSFLPWREWTRRYSG